MITFKFTVEIIGVGDDEESAWEDAQAAMPILLQDVYDVEIIEDEGES